MNNVVKKDLKLILYTKIWIIPLFYSLFGIYFLYGNKQPFSGAFFLILLFYIIINSLFAYDDKYSGEKFMYSFPVKRRDVVRGKYIILIISMASFATMFLISFLIFKIFNENFLLNIESSILIFRASLTFIALGVFFGIMFPLHYKYGYTKIRWLNFIILIITSIVTTVISDAFSESIGVNNNLLYLICSFIFFIVVIYFSMELSIKFCENRDI